MGKKILELGCGLGLTGIAVIKGCSPVSYTFTDHHPDVLNTACKNLRINFDMDKYESKDNEVIVLFDWLSL